MTGVYEIVGPTGRYIGSSLNIKRRWYIHQWKLRKGNHHSSHLQNAWNKYGENHFTFRAIEECQSDLLQEREQFYLDELNPEYNNSPTAGGTRGYKWSNESRARLSEIARNRPSRSAESRRKTSESLRGNKNHEGVSWLHTEDSKAKISAALKGHVVSVETRNKLRYARSAETRMKMSIAAKNRKR